LREIGELRRPMIEIEESVVGQQGLIVALRGSLNARTASEVKKAITAAADRGVRQVVVDLEEVPFIDSSGLVVLISGARWLDSHGGRLKVVAPQPQVRLLFELTMSERILHIYKDRADALVTSNN
jgi:anti-sigma B factor antagonist